MGSAEIPGARRGPGELRPDLKLRPVTPGDGSIRRCRARIQVVPTARFAAVKSWSSEPEFTSCPSWATAQLTRATAQFTAAMAGTRGPRRAGCAAPVVAGQFPGQAPGGDRQRGHHRLQFWPRSPTASSMAATTSPPGPNTGIATPQTPASSSHRVTATLVSLVTASARRNRSGEVIVCWVYGPQPAHDRHLDRARPARTPAAPGRAPSGAPAGWPPGVKAVAGRRARAASRCRRPRVRAARRAGPGSWWRRPRSSSTQGARSAMLGGQAVDGADHPQRQTGAVVTVIGALQQSPGGQLGRQPVGGGNGKSRQAGDLGQRMLAALGEGQQDRGDLAGHRSTRFGGVSRHGIPPSRCRSRSHALCHPGRVVLDPMDQQDRSRCRGDRMLLANTTYCRTASASFRGNHPGHGSNKRFLGYTWAILG